MESKIDYRKMHNARMEQEGFDHVTSLLLKMNEMQKRVIECKEYTQTRLVEEKLMTESQISMWHALKQHIDLEVAHKRLISKDVFKLDFSSLDLFRKGNLPLTLRGEEATVRLSDMGLEDYSLENTSVLGDHLVILSGSGVKRITEMWEKKDGFPLITIQISTKSFETNFAFLFIGGRWQLQPTNCFLQYSGEYMGGGRMAVYVKETAPPVIMFGSTALTTVMTPRYLVNKETWPIISSWEEGAVVIADHNIYRLKKHHTIDLRVVDRQASTKEGVILFKGIDGEGMFEFSLEGIIVRQRFDKQQSDPLNKFKLLQRASKLQDLSVYAHVIRPIPYRPSFLKGLRSFSDANPLFEAQEKNSQPITYDQYAIIPQVKVNPVHLLDISHYVNVDRYFRYAAYIKDLIRTGIDIDFFNLRKFLSASGIYLDYARYRLSGGHLGSGCYDPSVDYAHELPFSHIKSPEESYMYLQRYGGSSIECVLGPTPRSPVVAVKYPGVHMGILSSACKHLMFASYSPQELVSLLNDEQLHVEQYELRFLLSQSYISSEGGKISLDKAEYLKVSLLREVRSLIQNELTYDVYKLFSSMEYSFKFPSGDPCDVYSWQSISASYLDVVIPLRQPNKPLTIGYAIMQLLSSIMIGDSFVVYDEPPDKTIIAQKYRSMGGVHKDSSIGDVLLGYATGNLPHYQLEGIDCSPDTMFYRQKNSKFVTFLSPTGDYVYY